MTRAPDPAGLCLIGCGTAFDTIRADPDGHALPPGWRACPADGVASLARGAAALLADLDPGAVRLFVAVDEHALNFARLELYGRARIAGFRLATLRHASAVVAPDARLDDNVWIGAGALVGRGARIESDTMVSPGARVGAGAQVGPHGWIGAGAVVGDDARIGKHAVIGADTRLGAGLHVGAHGVVDTAGPWHDDLPDGRFATRDFTPPARLVGAGYSFQRRR